MCIQNLKTLALTEAKKFVTENLLGEEEKWTNKGNDKQQHVDSLLHNTTSHIQHLTQISLCITLEWEMEKWKKKAKFNHRILVFLFGPSQGVYKIWRLAVIGAENSETKSFNGEKEKWTNKGNDKQQHADSLLHNTTVISNICTKFKNPRRSSAWEIFDTTFPMYYIGVRDGKNGKRW